MLGKMYLIKVVYQEHLLSLEEVKEVEDKSLPSGLKKWKGSSIGRASG